MEQQYAMLGQKLQESEESRRRSEDALRKETQELKSPFTSSRAENLMQWFINCEQETSPNDDSWLWTTPLRTPSNGINAEFDVRQEPE
ncbi:unnamed protein product, partial [Didymodactylos carnosus]